MTESDVAYGAKSKYTEVKARAYANRDARRNIPELRLVARAFQLIPKPASVLDMPCGGGRVTVLLGQLGYQISAGDYSDPMLQITRETTAANGLKVDVFKEDIEQLSQRDKSFDAIICFRFFHHLPNAELRRKVVGELCRVARRHVAMSYFNPKTLRALEQEIRKLRGRKLTVFNTSLAEVSAYFAEYGFRLVKNFRLDLINNLHLAVFERVPR
ncbi:class I SAM-dependent methyltransferase [Accumulibacter sp.]|jgi:2-polyprenyl-3-methyl-5-hydroxy-6-metoxy-1,4-benzoquinol methylase|uniref:class I SAM-dependent methyltransferase n=1 Tax=Accumulibacter sp. TaxID=2053492 RepID=UPI002D1DF6A2|nr:class I SAM-dependent methyltransferase [Accumulibacter sp.]HPU81898.1 class I SAM-dependent methyltransferase [Accumulibacter sp.]